jgi:hypothetical protein
MHHIINSYSQIFSSDGKYYFSWFADRTQIDELKKVQNP